MALEDKTHGSMDNKDSFADGIYVGWSYEIVYISFEIFKDLIYS